MVSRAFFTAGLFLVVSVRAQSDVRLQLAKQWEKNGEFDRAAQELRMHLSEHPDDADAYRWMGDLRWRLGRLPQAMDSYRAGLRRDPGDSALKGRLALALEDSGRLARGEPPVLPPELAPTSPPPTKGAGGVAEEKPDSPEIVAVKSDTASKEEKKPALKPEEKKPAPAAGATRGLPLPLTDIYALPDFLQAIREYEAGRKEEAKKTLKRVLEKSPGHPGAYYLGGVIRYESGEYDKAEYNFKLGFAYPEKGFNAHFYLGRIYQKQGKTRAAIAAYEAYAKATQNETGRKQVQATIEELKRKTQPAPVDAKEPPKIAVTPQPKTSPPGPPEGGKSRVKAIAETIGPDAKSLAYPLGGGLFFIVADPKGAAADKLEAARDRLLQEKIEQSVQGLKTAQLESVGAANAEAVPLDLAVVYLKLGLWDQAAAQAGDYLERRGGKFERYARYLKALALIGLGKGSEAETLLLTVRAGNGFGPPAEETAFHLARACGGSGDAKRQAGYLQEAEKGLKDAARLLWIRQRLGGFWTKQGDDAKAAQFFRASLEPCADSALAEACAESSLRLADAEFRGRAFAEAQSAYGELLRRWPKHKDAAWAQYQIGNIGKASGDWESTLNAYQRVIDNYPYSYWAAQARWQREDAVWRKEYQGVLSQ